MSDNFPNTIGWELEGTSLPIESLTGLDSRFISTVTKDASVESFEDAITTSMRLFLGKRDIVGKMSPARRRVIGFEVVSRALELHDTESSLISTTNVLRKNGEIFSPRSSFHVHTGFPYGMVFAKNILEFGKVFEPLLFKIAGMRNEYRGAINRSAYARPLSAPPAVHIEGDSCYAVLSPLSALKADNMRGVWGAYGKHPDSSPQRYHPARYFASNLYSMALRGTMEYRYFNFSLRSGDLIAVASLCQSLSDTCIRGRRSDFEAMKVRLKLDVANSDNDYHNLLDEILMISERLGCQFQVSRENELTLRSIIDETPQPVFNFGRPSRTHLAKFEINPGVVEEFKLPVIDDADDPGTVDVHNFFLEDRSI